MPSRAALSVLVVAAITLAAAACSPRNASTPSPAADSGAEAALQRAQRSLAGGFTIDVVLANFVLPHWGGTDGGAVEVGPGGATARARLRRTGEDSTYTILLSQGATYFKRDTCDAYARVPGGTPDVLSPFLLNASNALASATDARFAGPAHNVIAATIPGLGDALIAIDPDSGRPAAIEFGDQPNNLGSTGFSFTFTQWGTPLALDPPTGDVPDRGPGGNPC